MHFVHLQIAALLVFDWHLGQSSSRPSFLTACPSLNPFRAFGFHQPTGSEQWLIGTMRCETLTYLSSVRHALVYSSTHPIQWHVTIHSIQWYVAGAAIQQKRCQTFFIQLGHRTLQPACLGRDIQGCFVDVTSIYNRDDAHDYDDINVQLVHRPLQPARMGRDI